MSETLQTQVRSFLDQLETVQEQLLELFVLKRGALVAGDVAAVSSLQNREVDGSKRLQALLGLRNRILTEAGRHIPVTTLADLADFCLARTAEPEAADWRDIKTRIELARERTARMRHESWVHWIICTRNGIACHWKRNMNRSTPCWR